MQATPDPRMVKLEPWMANLHSGIFDTTMHAQAVVAQAQKTLQDVSEDNEDYQQLKRDFTVAVSIYQGKHTHIDTLVKGTEAMQSRSDIPKLHLAQCYAAGACAIACQRMLDAIPEDLQTDDSILGSLIEKTQGHFTMWRHLTGVVEESEDQTD